MSRGRTIRRALLGTGFALSVASGGPLAADDDRPPAEDVLRIASDEPLTVRFSRPVTRSRVGPQSFRVERASDGEPASGRYVAGTFLTDPETGRATVVDVDGYIGGVQAVRGIDRGAATALVEEALARAERTGRVSALRKLDLSLFSLLGYIPDHGSVPGRPQVTPSGDSTLDAARAALRRLQSGDDASWEEYVTGGDVTAFERLAADPSAMRFHHSMDPVTGRVHEDSDFRRRRNRRVLLTAGQTGRVFTFVPDVPESADLRGTGFTSNDRYIVTLSRDLPNPLGGLLSASGFRSAVRDRVAQLETTNPLHDSDSQPASYGLPLDEPRFGLSEMNRTPLRVLTSTPPNGERLVDPATDWESPQNRFTVPASERKPFVARVRFNQPLDPRTVRPGVFSISQEGGGGFPVDVRLHQSRLGDAEVEIEPLLPLPTGAEFRIHVTSQVRTLDGRPFEGFASHETTFTTAAYFSEYDLLSYEFRPRDLGWTETGATHPRPVPFGRVGPFLPNDPVPVLAVESDWIYSPVGSPHFVTKFDDPATPDVIEGTVLHAPPGSSVRLFARLAPNNIVQSGHPQVLLAQPWVEVDGEHPEFNRQRWNLPFFQFRVEFTLPSGATAESVLPYLDRLSVWSQSP